MSDLFQDAVPDEYITSVATVMLRANWHTYQVLTKRAERLNHLLITKLEAAAMAPHIWWGVSVEDTKYGLPRMHHLQRSPARVRFVSIEPLLENLGRINLSGIHWVIVGGESGSGARPMQPDWVVSLQAQCARAKVPFFFKQWGGVQKGKYGRLLDGRTYDEMPEEALTPIPAREERHALAQALAPLVQGRPLLQVQPVPSLALHAHG